ncbi:MAG: MMPL family transporter [Oscillospiraceae bacterium]
MNRGTMELLFLYYASVNRGEADWTMSMQELFDYLHDQFLTDARFASFLTDDMRAQITGAQTMLTDAVAQLRGSNYPGSCSRRRCRSNRPRRARSFPGSCASLTPTRPGTTYLIGNSAMGYEMENSFHSELLLITLLTAVSIFLVVVFTFRSLIIPALLVPLGSAACTSRSWSSACRGWRSITSRC